MSKYTVSTATLSSCHQYRYDLVREWGPGKLACIIGLNPSSADAAVDDPTITREVSICRRNALDGFVKVNIFAYRSGKPGALRAASDPVGPANLATLFAATRGSRVAMVLCAWGTGAVIQPMLRKQLVTLRDAGVFDGLMLWNLGTSKDGYPKHPLYLPADTALQPWQMVSTRDQFPIPRLIERKKK